MNNNINNIKEICIKWNNYIKELNKLNYKLKEIYLNINKKDNNISKNNKNNKLNLFIQDFKNLNNPIIYKDNEDKN